MMYALIETLLLTLLLAACLWSFGGQIMPRQRAGLQLWFAQCLIRYGGLRLSRLGYRLLPVVAQHCGSGACNRCGVCEAS